MPAKRGRPPSNKIKSLADVKLSNQRTSGVTLEEFSQLYFDNTLVEDGLIFIWVEKNI